MSPTDGRKPPHPRPSFDGPDPDAPPNDDELRAAEALRRALDEERSSARNDPHRVAGEERPRESEPEARAARELAAALRAAASPREISAERHRAILDRALTASAGEAAAPEAARRGAALRQRAAGSAREHVAPLRGGRSKISYLAVGSAAGLLAAAAAVLLVVRGAAPDRAMAPTPSAERSAPALARSRSTADLFAEAFPRSGGTSDRVDRIAYARAQDFRQNRFARWGAQ